MFDATLLVEFKAGLDLKDAVILLEIDLKSKESKWVQKDLTYYYVQF